MKAVCWHGKERRARRDRAGSQSRRTRAMRSSGSRHAPSAAPTCTSTTAISPTMKPGDILGHEFMGEVVEVGRDVTKLKVGDRVVVPVHHRLRRAASSASAAATRCCDNSNPNAEMAEKAVRPLARRPLRLLAHDSAATPAARPSTLRVPFADVGPLKVPDEPDRRAGAVPVRHLPDRLHGRRELRHPARRHRRRLGLRPGRPVRHPQRLLLGAERVIAIDDGSRAAAMARGRRRRDDRLHERRTSTTRCTR